VCKWWAVDYRGANIGARVPDGLFVLDTDRALGHDQQRQVVRLLANTAFDVTTAGDAHGYIRVRPP
jgi:hypothetical protein